jgi:hypothetical protein
MFVKWGKLRSPAKDGEHRERNNETVIHLADDAYIAPGEARKLATALVELADYADGLRSPPTRH